MAVRNSCVETARTGSLANSTGITTASRLDNGFLIAKRVVDAAKIAGMPIGMHLWGMSKKSRRIRKRSLKGDSCTPGKIM